MGSIEELLSSTVSEYENISSLSGSALVSKCDKIRGNLKLIISYHLTDVAMLKREIRKTKGKTSHTKMVLDFLHHVVSRFPHPVFAPSPAQFQALAQHERESALSMYKDFIFTTCKSLLRLLAISELKDIHPTTLKLIITIVELIKTKNVMMLKILLTEVTRLCVELNQICEEGILTEETSVSLKSFSMDGEEQLTIQSSSSIDTLRKNCSQFLKIFVPDLRQFASDQVEYAWCLSLFQLERGNFELKSCSLEVLKVLLQSCEMPKNNIRQYLAFCIIASIEMVADLMKSKDPSLKHDRQWLLFVDSLSVFITEAFTLSSVDGGKPSESCTRVFSPKHQLTNEYITPLCNCLKNVLLIIKKGQDITSLLEVKRFADSVQKALFYIVSTTNISSSDCKTLKIVLEHAADLCELLMDAELLRSDSNGFTYEFLVQGLLLELECNITMLKDCEISLCNRVRDIVEMSLKHHISEILKYSREDSQIDLDKAVKTIQEYFHTMHVFVTAAVYLTSPDNKSPLKDDWLKHVFEFLLDQNCMKMLIKSFLDIMKKSLDVSGINSSKVSQFYAWCVKVVQLFNLLLHTASFSMNIGAKETANILSDDLLFYCSAFLSMPWFDIVKLEDLSLDMSKAEIYQELLLPVSRGLKKSGIDCSKKEEIDESVKDVILECLKCLAILYGGKYPRWRSTVLFKWATNMDANTCNIAFSVLPYFITTTLSGSGAFKGIFTHLKNLLAEVEKKYSHSNLLAICVLVFKISNFISGDYKIIIKPDVNTHTKDFCESCAQLEPNIAKFGVELKAVENSEMTSPKKAKDEVINLLGDVIKQIGRVMDGKWQLPQDFSSDFDRTTACIFKLQDTFLRLCSNYFGVFDKTTISGDVKLCLNQWIEKLKYYSESDISIMLRKILTASDGSVWNKELMQAIEHMLLSSVGENSLLSRLHYIKLVGCVLKSSLEFVDHEFKCPELFSWATFHLCVQLSSTITVVQSSAYLELCVLQGTEVSQRHRTEISICMARSFVCEQPVLGKRPKIEVLEDFAHLYSLNPEDFLHHNLHTILPIVATSNNGELLLKLFSEITGVSHVDILMQNFKHIFCHAVAIDYDLDILFRFLEKETRIKKESLLLLNFGGLLHHLVSYISLDTVKVHGAITVISKVKESAEKKSLTSGGTGQLNDLLQPHFLGILTFFNCQLRSASVSAIEKKRIIDSLTCLINLMQGKEITIVRVKIINTLCLAQQLYEQTVWYNACCSAWSMFIRCVEPQCLGPLLSLVAVTLLPLLNVLPEKVSTILLYLVIERADYTKDNLHELYFLPEHPALKKISKKVKEEIKKTHTDSLSTHLTQAVQLMTHDSAEVRVQALKRLRQTLKDKQRDVQQHHSACGRDVTDSVMSQLVSSLLFGCRDNNKQIRLLCGQSLGLIGAIDPERLVLSLPGTSVQHFDFFTIDDPNFAFHLISDLTKAFLAAKPTHQDISAFAIQELLKIYECKDGPKDTHGRRLWRRFSENVHEVLEPHHSSRYLLKKTDTPLSNLKQAVLFKKPNMTFRDWIGSFCAVLMQMVYESNDSCTASRVFRACSAVAKTDVNIALFLLPHTALQTLLMTDYFEFLVQEVLAVLKQTEELKERSYFDSAHNSASMRSNSCEDNFETLSNSQHARGSHLLQLCAQAIFSILDHITRWLRQKEVSNTDAKSKLTSSARSGQATSNISVVKNFLSKIPQLLLAQASFRCCAYRRALLHYEAHIRENRTSPSGGKGYTVDEQAIDFLQQLFVEMDEPDGVAGIAAVRIGKPTLNIQIKQLESTGKLQDACACYAHAIQQNPNDIHWTKEYIKCLLDLGQLSTAVYIVEGTITKQSSWKHELNSYRIEAAWRLGHWKALEECLDVPSDPSTQLTTTFHDWNTRLGELLLVVKEKKWDKFQALVNETYLDQTGPLSAASMESGSYSRGYNSILRLHMLSELEFFVDRLSSGGEVNLKQFADQCYGLWEDRIQPVQTSFKPREPLLSLQRAMLDLLSTSWQSSSDRELLIQKMVGKLWLESAKQARKAGYLHTAYNALINAQKLDLPEFCIEQAKWLWNKGESHQALLTLQTGVADHFPDNRDSSASEKMSKAKALLLVARLMEESSSFDSNTVLKQFREVVSYMSEWEDSHYYAAKYYDKLMTAFMGDNRSSSNANHLYYIMHHYGLSLYYGTSHIYESLTKLLTVWFDYEANVAKLQKANKAHNKDDAKKLINVVTGMRERLPAYIFLTAFSQLVSRICHPHQPTFEELKQIVVKVICAYPQQALWTMMAISKSSYPRRAQRCKEIFNLAEAKQRNLSKLLSDATKLTDRLLELCNKPCVGVQSLSITTHCKPLKRLLEEDTFAEILLPLQRFMTVTLPQADGFSPIQVQSTSKRATTSKMKEHDPFPENAIHIVGFEDTVEILPSLQRPKKVNIRASDGQFYLFLCKPKDDLRKDARLMEFNTIVNKCLKLDSETRKRQLKIRTYAVVPLNEECGLIEWVPNTHGLRNILLKIYRAKNMYTSGKTLKTLQLQYSAPLEKKLDVFRNKLLPKHPAVFGDWFLTTFPDPASWYNARLSYVRSTAVMSMVGYVLGLGDRHGENILFDSMTGEAVHVDFNCLFNKGLSLDVPEIVPFRLTHNMTDAMGPMRHEGFFRCACETVLRLLREQREPLLSVLKTFIYDPLVEWSKGSRGGQPNESGEILNEKALSHVSDIDKRLRGIAAKNKGLPLSVEGHVHYLIQEATDEEKLCQMYIGWAPYM